MRSIHQFANGIRVFSEYLLPEQTERYRICNQHEPEEETLFAQALSELSPMATFLSIGSAIGYYLILAKKLRPDLRVAGIEPLTEFLHAIIEHLELNDISADEITLFPQIASTHSAKRYVRCMGYSTEISDKPGRKLQREVLGSHLQNLLGLSAGITHARVDARPMGWFLDQLSSSEVFVQMDVQGHEAAILEASAGRLAAGDVRQLLIGTHGVSLHRRCCYQLRSCGFSLRYQAETVPGQPDGIIWAVRWYGRPPLYETIFQQNSRRRAAESCDRGDGLVADRAEIGTGCIYCRLS